MVVAVTGWRRSPAPGLLAGLLLLGMLAVPALRDWLEASPARHMLVQLPLLACAGVCIGDSFGKAAWRLGSGLAAYNTAGIPGTIVAAATAAFWMLPRSLDAALADPAMDAAKFASLPLLVGLPLALSWHRLPAVGRSFVKANLISMLAFMGWLYLTAPIRLCNFYLVDQQAVVGRALLLLAAIFAVFWAAGALLGRGTVDDREIVLVR